MSIEAPRTPAERAVRALRELHERLARDLGYDDTKAPAWRLHLPSGSIFNIRRIRVEDPFVLFIGFWASASTVDFVLVAPEAVAVTIETAESLDVSVAFDSPDDV